MAAASLVEPGDRVLVAGGPGVVEAVEARGADVVLNTGQRSTARSMPSWSVCTATSTSTGSPSPPTPRVRGARLIGTNADPTFPTPNGLQPGGGAILAAIATASGVDPVIAGKPHQPMADLVSVDARRRRRRPRSAAVADGRRPPETDGLFADGSVAGSLWFAPA